MSTCSKLLILLLLLSGTPVFAKKAEKYSATENDGTPTMIHSSTPTLGTGTVIHLAREERVPTPAERQRKRLEERDEAAKNLRVREISESEIKEETAAIEKSAAAQNTAEEDSKLDSGFSPTDATLDLNAATTPTEHIQDDVTAVAPTVAEQAVESRLDEKAQVTETVRAEAAKKAELEARKKKYDVVPEKHVKEFQTRMKYAYEIFRRYDRLYDYRILTARELKALLTQLQKQEN